MISPAPANPPRARPGFTLVEVLLVLGVLAVIAALAWPSLGGALERFRLRKAADQIRIQWQQARIQAIRSNCRWEFRYVPGGRQWLVQSVAQTETMVDPTTGQMLGSVGPALPGAGLAGSSSPGGSLPEGVRFAPLPGSEDTLAAGGGAAGSSAYGAELSTDPLGQQLPPLDESDGAAGWSWPIYFYPDGTTDSAAICLENEKGRRIEVRLRGLTGTVTIGANTAAEETLP